MEVLKEIKSLETEGKRLVERAEREGEKRLLEAKRKAAEAKNRAISDAVKEAEEIIGIGRKKGKSEAARINAKTAKEIDKIKATASRKKEGARKTIFKVLLGV